MASIRVRVALLAALATAAAVAIVSVLLLSSLNGSLREEITESVVDQTVDYDDNIYTDEDIAFARLPGDPETLFAVFLQNGDLLDTNDPGVDGGEIAKGLGGNLLEISPGEILVGDLSLDTPTLTPGSEDMIAAYAQLQYLETTEPTYVLFARATAGVDRTVDGLRNRLLLGVPLFVLFIAALAWWLAGRALAPVDRMRREVDEISSSDLSRRVSEPASRDEVGQLGSTMNRMLGRLQTSHESQEQFVSDAAHELRTPLASIAAQLDVDASHPETADPAVTNANVRAEVSRLQALIDGLLRSARSTQGDPQATAKLLDLDVLAGDSITRHVARADVSVDQRNISAATVRGDAVALASAIDNLLANAVRHAAGRVSVGVGTDAGSAWLTVDDDGPGVPLEDRERIFDRFVRLDDARARDDGGSGLGLALARETAQRHGGTLTAEASPLGGARLVLRVPEA